MLCLWHNDNLNDDAEEEDDGYYDKTSADVEVVVRLLYPRDGVDRQADGLAGKQTERPGGITALSGCYYLSVSIPPSTGQAYRQNHWRVNVWKVKGDQCTV